MGPRAPVPTPTGAAPTPRPPPVASDTHASSGEAPHGSPTGHAKGRGARALALVLRIVAAALGVCALWAGLAASLGAPLLPGGGAFAAVGLAAAAAAGSAGAKALGLPGLLGSLAAGVLLRSLGAVSPDAAWQHAAAVGRKSALAVILLRAGLGLDASALRRLSAIVIRMTALPSLVEAVALATTTRLLLDLPWLWGLMAGAMMAAVSPAVVIPALFRLQEKGFGTDKGIPTLVVAAASFDDVIAVTAFGVLHSLVFSHGDGLWDGVQRGLLALPMGLAFGAAWGFTARFMPNNEDAQAVGLRSLLLLGGALLGVLGAEAWGYGAAGPLAAIVASFVAAHAWRSGDWDGHSRVEAHFRTAWAAFEVLLFALIGVEVDVRALAPLDVALCTTALALALAVRIAATVAIAFGGGFTWKEKLFLAFAWFPKATVQAALGPAALDSARALRLGAEAEARAQQVLTLAALAILLTAPLGAALLHYTGPRLLRRPAPTHQQDMDTGQTGNPAITEDAVGPRVAPPPAASTNDTAPCSSKKNNDIPVAENNGNIFKISEDPSALKITNKYIETTEEENSRL